MLKKFIPWAADRMTRYPWVCMAAAILVGAFFWAHLPRVVLRSDIDDFVVENDPAYLLGNSMKALFPRNEFFLIVFQTENVFTARTLTVVKSITEAVRRLEGVDEVISLARVDDMVGTEDAFIVEPLFEEVPTAPAELLALRRRVMDGKFFRKTLVSEDGRTTAIAVYLPPNSTLAYPRILGQTREVLAPFEKAGMTFHLAGWPVTNTSMARFTNDDVKRFVPLTLLLTLIAVWVIFRNPRLLLLAGVGIIATLSATVGWAGFANIPLSMTSVAVIPLVITLALSDMAHLFSHLDGAVVEKHPDRREAMRHVLEQILFPCFLTSLNTAIGFAALTWTSIPAIRYFGTLAAAGMFFEFGFTFGLVMPLLLLFRTDQIYHSTQAHENRWIPRLVRFIEGLVKRRAPLVFGLCIAALLWGFWQTRALRVETSPLDFFPKGNPHRMDMEFVRDHLAGVTSVDVSLRAEGRDAFRDPALLRQIEAAQEQIAALAEVDTAFSLADFLKRMNKAFHADDPAFDRLPETRGMVDQFLLLYSGDDIGEYVNSAYDWTRLRLRLKTDSSREIIATMERIREILVRTIPGVRADLVGTGADMARAQEAMVDGQIQNIAAAVGTIWLVMVVVLRSVGMALLFLIPNLFPIFINFGLMGAVGIPLNTGTSLIAASAFGIIVDDTVHFFTRLQELRRWGRPFEEALHAVTLEKGESSLSAAFILMVGFGVLVLGHFLPVIYFGLLNVFIMAVGMAGDMFFLKSIFILWPRWFKKTERAGR